MPTRRLPDDDEDYGWHQEPCRDPDHQPPTMVVLPPGRYEHECSACGRKTTFRVDGIELQDG